MVGSKHAEFFPGDLSLGICRGTCRTARVPQIFAMGNRGICWPARKLGETRGIHLDHHHFAILGVDGRNDTWEPPVFGRNLADVAAAA